MSKTKKKKLTIEQKRKRIIAHDILAVYEDSHNGDYSFLISMLTGEGATPALKWSKAEVEREWREGEYDDPDVKEFFVKNSRGYEMVKDLWEV